MKLHYIIIAVVSIIVYNGLIIKRDQRMFESYDKVCASLPVGHPDCVFAKRK